MSTRMHEGPHACSHFSAKGHFWRVRLGKIFPKKNRKSPGKGVFCIQNTGKAFIGYQFPRYRDILILFSWDGGGGGGGLGDGEQANVPPDAGGGGGEW